jgi:hypothetical protein
LQKKTAGIVALVLTLLSTNIALAIVYMTKTVTITGGVAETGTIEVYQENAETTLTTIAISQFQGTTHSNYTYFWINNTGNMPVKINWEITNPNPTGWTIDTPNQGYIFTENTNTKYTFSINNQINPDGTPGTGKWLPDPTGTTQTITIPVGKAAKFSMDLIHNQAVNTPGDFSFGLSFTAQSV